MQEQLSGEVFCIFSPGNILHISFRSARSAEESARSVPSLSDSPGFFLPDGFPLPQKVLLQKFPDALPGILPDRSFCETAVFRNNYGNDTLSHLPHRQRNSLSESLFRHRYDLCRNNDSERLFSCLCGRCESVSFP